jgi:transposase
VRFADDQWELLVTSIPLPAYTGRPRADDRNYINGILYVLMTGCRWMDMPTKYGSYKTVWERHKKWSDKGVCMEKYYEFPGVTWIYFWIDKDRRPFCG